MAKVRRIDWSPDEYIGGTFGKLTVAEHGVYIIVLSLIYSNGGPIENDVRHITRACADTHWRTVQVAVAGLVAKGKLTVSPDGGWLTNGRAEEEIDRALWRMDSAQKNGEQGGRARKLQDLRKTCARPAQDRPVLAKNKDLAKPGGSYHQHQYERDKGPPKKGAPPPIAETSFPIAAREAPMGGPPHDDEPLPHSIATKRMTA